MSETYNTSRCRSSGKIQWNRDEVASTIIDFESFRHKQSQRQFAKEQGVPRTSLQHWLARRECIAHRRVANKMDDVMIAFGRTEQKRLSQSMPAKKISLCEDETFHPETCLVAMEPVSRFILVEQYEDNRESATWNCVVDKGLGDLPVEVIQVVSDEARALISHATQGLKVHHSSDCFHVSHEIGKGTSGALAAEVKKREKEQNDRPIIAVHKRFDKGKRK